MNSPSPSRQVYLLSVRQKRQVFLLQLALLVGLLLK